MTSLSVSKLKNWYSRSRFVIVSSDCFLAFIYFTFFCSQIIPYLSEEGSHDQDRDCEEQSGEMSPFDLIYNFSNTPFRRWSRQNIWKEAKYRFHSMRDREKFLRLQDHSVPGSMSDQNCKSFVLPRMYKILKMVARIDDHFSVRPIDILDVSKRSHIVGFFGFI